MPNLPNIHPWLQVPGHGQPEDRGDRQKPRHGEDCGLCVPGERELAHRPRGGRGRHPPRGRERRVDCNWGCDYCVE